MYSKKINSILRENKIDVGDEISIMTTKGKFKGIVLPRISFGNNDALMLKLENGYNLGILSKNIKEIKLTKKNAVNLDITTKKKENSDNKESKDNNKEYDVLLLGCGGTIASKIEYKTGAVYPSINPKELIRA